MFDNRAFLVFEYEHLLGAWTVAADPIGQSGLFGLVISDGVLATPVSFLLNENQLDMAVGKIRKIPKGRISSYRIFVASVSGAVSLTVKYGR